MTSRRDRLREAASSEILDAARVLLAAGGPSAVSLRAIARQVGLAPAALYRYFANLGELTEALCAQLHDDARAVLEAAGDAAGADQVDRMLAVSHELRRWALEHRVEFGLMYGCTAAAPSAARLTAQERVAAVFLGARPDLRRLWSRLCGLVAMEVFGHLGLVADDADRAFATELAAMAQEWDREPA